MLCKGGHQLNDANDLLYANDSYQWFEGKRIDNPNTHGTGCTLSSAIASNLAKGYDLNTSVKRAKDYISERWQPCWIWARKWSDGSWICHSQCVYRGKGRISRWNDVHLFMENGLIWFGAGVSIAEILTGTYFSSLGFGKGMAAILMGHVIGCLMLFLAGVIGGKSRLSAMETVKSSFGSLGGLVFAFLNVLQLVGWTAIMIYDGALGSRWHFFHRQMDLVSGNRCPDYSVDRDRHHQSGQDQYHCHGTAVPADTGSL